MANNIAVSITADVADLQVKRAIMSAELKAATKDLNAFAKEAASTGSTDALRAGMLASAEAAEKARVNIAKVNAELKAIKPITHGFESVFVAVGEMGVHLRETVGVIGEMREAMMAFSEAAIAAFALEQIAEFAKKMGETAEQTKHLSETFGLTVPQVQGLQAAAALTGIGIDTITKALGIFDKNMVAAANGTGNAVIAFRALGISVSQGKDQMTLMLDVADKFKNMEDGPKKVALAMQLFGRAGKDMIPFLNEGAEGIAHLDVKTQEYSAGLLVATAANQQLSEWLLDVNKKGVALAESTNEQAVAFKGVSNVLTDAFAPMLKEATDGVNSMILAFIESYRKGGDAKEILSVIAGVARVLGEVLYGVGSTSVELYNGLKKVFVGISSLFGDTTKSINGNANIIDDAFASITNGIEELRLMIAIGCEAIGTSFQLLCEMISSLWSKTTHNIQAEAEASTRKIKEMYDALQKVQAADAKGVAFNARDDKKNGIKTLEGSKDFDTDLVRSPKAKNEKKASGPSILDAWKLELADALNEEKNWGADESAFSLQFWTEKLGQVKAGSKEELEIRRDIAHAKMALFKEEQQLEVAGIKELEADRLSLAKAQSGLEKIVLQEKLTAIDEEVKAGQLGALQAAEQRRTLNATMEQYDIALAEREYRIKLASLNQILLLEHLKPQQRAQVNVQIEQLEKQHQDQMTILNAQANQKRMADDAKVADAQRAEWKGVAKTFGDALGQMATFQKSFAATVNGLWQSLVGGVSQAISRMVTNWITSIAMGEAAEFAAHFRLVAMHAKTAAAGAWKAVVGIPIIGPVLAPIAAATAFAGVMAFSAEGGMGTVPYDNAPFLLHKNEMVLPADLATRVRAMTGGASGDASFPSAANSNGGDTHIHIHAMDTQSIARFARDNGHHFAAGVKKAVRDGWRG
jgi:hypothetical protein